VLPKLAVAVTICVLAALAVASSALARTYFGVVGPGATVTLENAAGQAVHRIKAGTHTIKVSDKASLHNFHLLRNGINKKTRIPFVGKRKWTLTFPAGSYRYRCDSHRLAMHGGFKAVA
jgi:plastocyanin